MHNRRINTFSPPKNMLRARKIIKHVLNSIQWKVMSREDVRGN